jgi:putative transposase
MARHHRVTFPGIALHVRQRGNDRQDCFREEADRLVYLSALRALCDRWACALHAYCLMTNHVHLLLTPMEGGDCSMLMRDLGRSYVRYFNDRHARTGTLWEGRFQSCLVDSPTYVMGCYRYVEENPVRAGMVARAVDYPWSSYASNAGIAPDPSLEPHCEYLALGQNDAGRQASYAGLFNGVQAPGMVAAFRLATSTGYPLADDALKQSLATRGFRIGPEKRGPKGKMEPKPGPAVCGQLGLDVGEL